MTDTNGTVRKRIFFVSNLREVEAVVEGRRVEVALQHDDVDQGTLEGC